MASFLPLLCIGILSVVHGRMDMRSEVGGYDNLVMQDFYKQLANIDPAYFLPRDEDINDDSDDNVARDWEESEVRSIPRSPAAGGQTDIRDSEYIGHSSNAGSQGFMYMSGGAGEGKQHLTPNGDLKNIQQVKSDETLPYYCHPPNPCPKGFTAKDGCEESIEDTAEMQKAWIEKMMEKGMCSCDEEHMFECPTKQRTESMYDSKSTRTENDQQEFDDVIDNILGNKPDGVNNPYIGGQKRQSLVAKKSPRVKRDQPDDRIEKELDKLSLKSISLPSNPYLVGEQLHRVAKKGFAGKQDK